ncbi:toll/interleukin-1 receptor domain-containing protein [Streptomyces alboniger]|uniref:Toll/interleukin-1 receptor domain-containing protein n=1 Tax=Streptomyces alboniger TaxID=132473 RepID=A0A5J6HLD0_STRAD|nr:toll/interleukin-1 receptor domain-containing protein [Streptomyces alboniger]QEV19304.1 toll/interleukin-1 receptor domain-containing protein [Streptomyces alboniger]
MWDVFLSYSRKDAGHVRRFHEELIAAGLKVFTDESAVAGFAGISETIRRALANSRVLLAYYSLGYPERPACQWELTTAFLAGLGEGDPRRRVLVVNPERDTAHIHPVELRDSRHGEPETLVPDILAHLRQVSGPMRPDVTPPRVHGELPAAVGEFTGRLPELWRLHSALHVQEAPLVTGRTSARPVQLRGMPGIGKTRLAREYALRFGAAFPGGVHWARAAAPHPPRTPDGPCLYVVDDVPHGLPPRAVTDLTAPHPLVRTLLITRSRAYGGHGEHLDLEPLPQAAAAALAGAPEIVDAAAGHPGALGLLGRAVGAGQNPAALANRLYEPGRSLLDILAGDELTADHVRDALTAPAEAQDVLRCALALSPLPVTAETAATVLAAADRLPRAVALRRARSGLAELTARGLLTPAPHLLHPVTAHSWLHHEGDSARAETLRRAVLSSLGATATTLDNPGPPVPGVRKESVPMTVSEAERMAAFDLQVELVSRIGIQQLPADGGSLREALTSLNSLFPFTRDTLHRYSIGLRPSTGPSVQSVADQLLNGILRPFMTRWHPLLMAWEAHRPPHTSALDHERTWDRAESFRADLNALHEPLRGVAASLAAISGADFGVSTEV